MLLEMVVTSLAEKSLENTGTMTVLNDGTRGRISEGIDLVESSPLAPGTAHGKRASRLLGRPGGEVKIGLVSLNHASLVSWSYFKATVYLPTYSFYFKFMQKRDVVHKNIGLMCD